MKDNTKIKCYYSPIVLYKVDLNVDIVLLFFHSTLQGLTWMGERNLWRRGPGSVDGRVRSSMTSRSIASTSSIACDRKCSNFVGERAKISLMMNKVDISIL